MLHDKRKKAIEMIYEGFTGNAVAEKFGVDSTTVSGWAPVLKVRQLKREGKSLDEIIEAILKPQPHGNQQADINREWIESRLLDIEAKLDSILEFVSKF